MTGNWLDWMKEAGNRGAWSLARVQMALWTFLIIEAFLFLWAVTGETQPLTASLLALMGLGAGTSLGAALIDAGKQAKAKDSSADLELKKHAKEAELAELTTAGAIGEKLDAVKAAIRQIKEDLVEAAKPLVTKSEGPFVDLFQDANGAAFHRVRMALWTFVLAAVFVTQTVTKLAMPELDPTLLALLGISSGTYLGFKLPEKN